MFAAPAPSNRGSRRHVFRSLLNSVKLSPVAQTPAWDTRFATYGHTTWNFLTKKSIFCDIYAGRGGFKRAQRNPLYCDNI